MFNSRIYYHLSWNIKHSMYIQYVLSTLLVYFVRHYCIISVFIISSICSLHFSVYRGLECWWMGFLENGNNGETVEKVVHVL